MPGSGVRPGKKPKTSLARVASLPPAPPVGQPARCFQQQESASQSPAVGNLIPLHPILTSGSCRPHFSARPGRQPKPFPQTSPIFTGVFSAPLPASELPVVERGPRRVLCSPSCSGHRAAPAACAEISGQHPKSQLGPTFLFPERIDLTILKWTFLPALPQGYGDKDTLFPGLPKPFPSNNSFHSSRGVHL